MGLAPYVIDAIVREHAYRPIAGDVLLIGRQTIYATADEAIDILRSHAVTPAIDAKDVALDRGTLNLRSGLPVRAWISDIALFALLGNRKVKALDHSSYEGAEVVHDLTTEVPPRLKGCADFIVDGSTLDNTFNPALTLKNYADLLRPGGRLVATNQFSNDHDPYVIPSPAWYLDYFVMNRFADCRVYVVVHMPEGPNVFCVNPDCLLDPNRRVDNFKAPFELGVVVVAEKGAGSTTTIWPTQAQYRSAADWGTYRANLTEMVRSGRPHLMRSWTASMCFRKVVSGYRFMNHEYAALEPLDEERRLQVLQAKLDERLAFERSIPGRLENFLTQLAQKAGYTLVRLPVAERKLRTAELASLLPRTLAGKAKHGLLLLLHKAGYDLVKPSEENPRDSRPQESEPPIHDARGV